MIPSALEYHQEGGIDMTDLQRKLLRKIEELTLYTLELEARLATLETQGATGWAP